MEKMTINGKECIVQKLNVKATAFTGRQRTYVGTWATVNKTIAVDPKVIPLGSKVYIPQFGIVFTAEDTGSAIKGNKIDIFMKNYNTCIQWGIRDIEIYLIKG